MFMMSWYAETSRLRTSTAPRNETLAFCISSMTCGRSMPGLPLSKSVAATRAREGLVFTYPRQVYDRSLGIILNRPSRFIDMIPEEILEKRSIGFSGRSQYRW